VYILEICYIRKNAENKEVTLGSVGMYLFVLRNNGAVNTDAKVKAS